MSEIKKTKKVPMTNAERQRLYLKNPENVAKHKQRQREYYLNVIKPKRDALRRTRQKQEIEKYVKLVEKS